MATKANLRSAKGAAGKGLVHKGPASKHSVKEPVITLSAGPVAAYPRILRAMSRPVQYDFDPWFQDYYEAITRKAAKAMCVRQPALILQCEPAPGIEATAASLISPKDV